MVNRTDFASAYESKCRLYGEFSSRLAELIERLLTARSIKTLSIDERLKQRDSFLAKIQRDGSHYEQLEDITDLAGIRVITYYEDEVSKVAETITSEFDIDIDNSVDKGAQLDPDRFGYVSLHYVVSLSQERASLPEYEQFSECKAEVQIRSVLQHAWAEIEHDLGYKSEAVVPREERRRFSRLAGLLEIADSEFVGIRDSLDRYASELPEIIMGGGDDLPLDGSSYGAFVTNDVSSQQMDMQIADASNVSLFTPPQDEIADDLARLSYLGVETIGQLRDKIKYVGADAVALAQHFLRDHEGFDSLSRGIGVFYVCHVLAAQSGSVEDVFEYLSSTNLMHPDRRRSWAANLIETLQNVRGGPASPEQTE